MLRLLTLFALLAFPVLVSAQEPHPDDADDKRQAELSKLPQWQRMLKGEGAKKADELQQLIARLHSTDDYEGASKAAQDLLTLRFKSQGADHHEAITVRFEVSKIQKLAAQPAAKRQEWRTAVQRLTEAQLLNAQGQYAKAYPALKCYADLCRELLGEDHPATANSYINLGLNLNAQGKSGEAHPLYQKALEIYRQVFGEDHPNTALSYNNLANNLNAQGKAGEAHPLFQKALEIYRRVFGEDHPNTATTYFNLALNLDAQGRAAEAQPLLQKVLEIRRRVLGEEHPQTANCYNSVADNLNAQGKAAEAHPYYERALEINLRVLGEDHPNTATSYNKVGANLVAQKKAAEALLLFQKALEIRRRRLGDDHPETATSYNNVAVSLLAQGKAREAQLLFHKALEMRHRINGEDHRDTAQSYSNVAISLTAQGKAAEAQALVQKALEIRRRLFGEDHPDTAESYNSVAHNLDAQGKATEAQLLFQKALEISRRVLGEGHPDTADSYSNVAYSLDAQGKIAQAEPFHQKALEIRRHVFGEYHPGIVTSYNNVASNLKEQGKTTEAGLLFQKALEIQSRIFGTDHPDTALGYHNIAMNLEDQGKIAEAQLFLQNSLEIRRRVLGQGHPKTANSYCALAFNLGYLGKSAEAETYLRPAVFSYEASRLTGATGLDRASLDRFNPRLYLAVLTQAREPLQAWGEVELSLARGLLDQQANAKQNSPAADEIERTRERGRVAVVQPEILSLLTKPQRSDEETSNLEKLLTERRQAEERLGVLAVKASTREVASSDAIQSALPAEAALLMWVDVVSGDLQEHWSCVVRRTGDPKWERLPAAATDGKWSKDDSSLPSKLRAALAGSGPRAEVESLAQQLHAQRIAPILKHLDGVTTLYVVGVNEMAGIPVEALSADYTISYVPSGTFLARRGEPLAKPKTLLALGDPAFPEQQVTAAPTALPPAGLLITRIVPGGPAAKALLKTNDVLVSYAGTKLESIDQFRQVLASKYGERSVPIQIWRGSEDKLATYDLATGNPGFVLAKEPAREAIAARRKADQLLASVTRGGEWGELPGTHVELSELTKLFEPGNVTALTRSEASEPALNELRKKGDLTKFRYLHFATHGEVNNVRAFDSKLILAQDHPKQVYSAPGEPLLNNELSASEVLDHWKLDAELVTLSACETALGRNAGGDGMLGFAQAFLLAGSRSVCLSLWKVDDTATALLMDRFYRNLLGKREDGAKPMGKAAALHEAKTWLKNLTLTEATDRLGVLTDGVSRGSKKGREVIGEVPSPKDSASDSKPYSHPKYWAAFILIGDPD